MKKILYTLVVTLLLVAGFSEVSLSQVKLQEGFETTDTIPGAVPPGWSVWNNAIFPIEPTGNWMARDSGRSMPGLSNGLSKSHSGKRSMGATWYAGIDTNTGTYGTTDAWLVTKRISGVTASDSLRFFMSGGSASYWDSVQVWVGFLDSMPTTFLLFESNKLGTIKFPGTSGGGSVYGQFIRKAYGLGLAAGFPEIWIGFRYFTNTSVDGFAVYLDDVMVGSPNVGVTPISSNVPSKYDLSQNYPNPFNPTTNINFDLPKSGEVQLTVFNSMGQEIKSLVSGFKAAGSYKVDFDASALPSGTYFYKLTTSDFVSTKKMILVK